MINIILLALIALAQGALILPNPIINDPTIDVELLSCNFTSNEYIYRLINTAISGRTVYVYGGQKGEVIDIKKGINYAKHEFDYITSDYNIIKPINNGNITSYYAVLFVEDEAGNLLLQKPFDCEIVNKEFEHTKVFPKSFKFGEDAITLDLVNFGENPSAIFNFNIHRHVHMHVRGDTIFSGVFSLTKSRLDINIPILISLYCNETIDITIGKPYQFLTFLETFRIPCPSLDKFTEHVQLQTLKQFIDFEYGMNLNETETYKNNTRCNNVSVGGDLLSASNDTCYHDKDLDFLKSSDKPVKIHPQRFTIGEGIFIITAIVFIIFVALLVCVKLN